MRRLAILAAGLLTACAAPTVTMMGRTTGALAEGTFKGGVFTNGGSMNVTLRGEHYEGTWLTVRDPGSMSFSLLSTFGRNGGGATGSIFGIKESNAGFGTAMMHAPSGATLRCEFRYSNATASAIGVCQHKDGEVFDLQAKL